MQGKRPEKPWRRKCRAADEEETLKLRRERESEREGERKRTGVRAMSAVTGFVLITGRVAS